MNSMSASKMVLYSRQFASIVLSLRHRSGKASKYVAIVKSASTNSMPKS